MSDGFISLKPLNYLFLAKTLLFYSFKIKRNMLSRVTVTKTRVWKGNWIYWILTGRNYK
jgi:hypothetical protein